MEKLIIKHCGEFNFNQSIIDNAPTSGPFDNYAEYLTTRVYDVETTLKDTIAILEPYGAWNSEELQNLEDNINRILWVKILDCQEFETTWTYFGE